MVSQVIAHSQQSASGGGGGEGDKYFARMSKNQVHVYETPEMSVLDKKSIKLEGVQDFEWCPTSDILSVYQV